MCGPVDTVFPGASKIPSGAQQAGEAAGIIPGAPDLGPAPGVVRSSPKADDATIQGKAASTSRLRRRFSSLLATGGGGDASPVAAAVPAGKPNLGA